VNKQALLPELIIVLLPLKYLIRRFVRRNEGSGTFRRLGIPKGQALPKELQLAMHRLEDKNLSPIPDTVAGNFGY
jgi:hypothetical protein